MVLPGISLPLCMSQKSESEVMDLIGWGIVIHSPPKPAFSLILSAHTSQLIMGVLYLFCPLGS